MPKPALRVASMLLRCLPALSAFVAGNLQPGMAVHGIEVFFSEDIGD